MGVYENQPSQRPGMHWPQPERQQPCVQHAYDPSRDLSPNLPHQASSSASSCSSSSTTPTLRPKQERPCSPASSLAGDGGPASTTTTELEAAGPCAGCGQRISDRFYLLAVDRRWHAACLQCCSCRHALDGEVTCFSRDGNIYCKKDYYRLFGMKRCARCQAAISSSELVMRARELVFHVACFTCALCHSPLSKGDHFGLREGVVLCRLHYETLPPATSPTPSFPPQMPMGPHGPHGPHGPPHGPHGPMPPHHHDPKLPFFNGGVPPVGVVSAGPRQKGRPRKRKPKELEGITAAMGDMGGDSYLDGPFGPGTPGMHGNSRSKRMRTSFKHHQLRTMKSYFAINHNPDAKDLKQLSQKTGLPKRVLQVWFQNARAKWRRLMLKQEGKGGDKCGGDSPGDMDHGFGGSLGGAPGGPHSPQFILGGSPLEC
ncbi:LIM/homeobox protein Lhx9-like [Thrips palmi]|uniref:LIM/homeobox protein Lhx9-like n=1 Tax=Thrips palmi TaxID=161013 RepID=A0A6P8XZN7_THRPL|nr:LIM/homeobox protein Lhx9-like [Thrips palmi]